MKEPAIKIPEGCTEVLLHACCAPCSSAIVEWMLANGVRPTIYYYNPNIWPREEYEIRKNESKRHAEGLGIQWIDGDYDHEEWRNEVSRCEDYDYTSEPERGRRCEQCFTLRLTRTARKAQELGLKYFATTLASSRWKSLEQIERAGRRAEQIVYESTQKALGSAASPSEEPSLLCTFWAQNWRKGGLQERRNQLLKEFGFYNQQYCGCEFSARGAGALTKPLLREQMREAKRQHADKMAGWSAEIVEKLWQQIGESRVVMAFWPLPDEVDVRPLIDRLVAEGRTVVLPKVTGDKTMELRRYTSQADLSEGAFHILEPVGEPFVDYEQIDVALVPGVAFDAAGHRLGRGRGYYDRFLAEHLAPRLIGVCFPFQRVAVVPVDAHDVVLDQIFC
jgi:5,10-methenyltetrahydrofolate synthetase